MSTSAFEQQHGYYLEEIETGMSALFAKTVTEADITLFAGVSGDTNPLHLNRDFAAQTRFKKPIVHGMLTTSLWSTIVGTRLPGPGSAYLSQEMKFIRPVYAGDTVLARMTVTAVNLEKQQVSLDAECLVGETLVAFGRGVVWVPRRSSDHSGKQ